MKRVAIEHSRVTLQQASCLAKKGLVVLTEKGRPVAALVDVEDDLALEALALSRNKSFMAYLDACAAHASGSGAASIEEVRREFGLLKGEGARGAGARRGLDGDARGRAGGG